MTTVKDLDCKAIDVFKEVEELTKESAMSKFDRLPKDEKGDYSVGSLNIFTCGMWCKKVDQKDFPSDKEWISIVDDWNKTVVLPHAESLRRFIKLHPDFDIPQQMTGVESGRFEGIYTKQSLINSALNL